jgi:hypothetical protein
MKHSDGYIKMDSISPQSIFVSPTAYTTPKKCVCYILLSSFNSTLFISIKQKAKYGICVAAMLFYILQKVFP